MEGLCEQYGDCRNSIGVVGTVERLWELQSSCWNSSVVV